MLKEQKRSLITLYLAYFADYFCWGVAVALIACYISPEETSPFTDLFFSRQASLGIALAAFPVGEVIGSPLLGDLSDWIGRKKILIGGLWGSIFCMLLCTFALHVGSFALFVLGQFLVGFLSGKQAMAQAAIAEIEAGDKGQKMVFLSVVGGISWIVGPAIGGVLMQAPMGGTILPSLLATLVFAVSLILTYAWFTDTYQPQHRDTSISKFWGNIGGMFVLTWKESLFFIFFLNLLGWYLLVVSLSDFLIVRFNLTTAQIGFFNSYVSLCFTAGGIIGTLWILHRWRAKHILFWSALIGSVGIFLIFGAQTLAELWTYLAIPAVTESWLYPAYQTVLSDRTSEQNQGKLFGLIGASNGACQFVASIVLGGFSSQSAILIAAILFLSSAALLPVLTRKRLRTTRQSQ